MGIFMVAFCQMMEDVHSMKEEKVASECKYNDNGVLKSEEERENEIISMVDGNVQIVTEFTRLMKLHVYAEEIRGQTDD